MNGPGDRLRFRGQCRCCPGPGQKNSGLDPPGLESFGLENSGRKARGAGVAFPYTVGNGRVRLFAATGFLFLLAAFLLFAGLTLAGPVLAGPVAIVDDAGQKVSLPAPAKRVIPLYAGLSDSLLALGLLDNCVGRTVSDDILPAELPSVGTHMRPNPELIAALKPDLVLQLEGRSEAGLAAQSLMRLGIPVARFRISSFAELFSCIERLGVLCARESEAAALRADMVQRLEAIRQQSPPGAPRPRFFFEVRYPNLLGAGGGSMLSGIIEAAGGDNCLADHSGRMVRLNEEVLVSLNPDIYLVQEGPMNKNPSPPGERAHFRTLKAVKEGQVFFVSEALFSRPGPRSIAAVEELAEIIRQWREKTVLSQPE